MTSFAERTNGLQWRLRAMRRLWSAGAEPAMPFIAPLPVIGGGELDAPGDGTSLRHKPLMVNGWIAFKAGPTARVEVRLGETSLGLARLGLPRPDLVNSEFAPHAATSGFELTTELDDSIAANGPLTLRVIATATDGATYELDPVLVHPRGPAPAPKQPLRPLAEQTPRKLTGTGPRTLVFTHQLNLGGGQLYLQDLLRQLHERGAVNPVVVSAMDGVIREELEAMGIPVHITSPIPHDDLSSHLGRIEEFLTWAEPYEFELALVNTATTHAVAGAEIAMRLGIPAIWAIHESFPPGIIWADFAPGVRELTERAIGRSTTVFEADATKELYAPILDPAHSVTLPYGLDMTPIERQRERFDPVAARADAGLPQDAEVILCVGTIEPRKAQLSLAIAFDLIAARHPRAQLVFVGGRDDAETNALRKRVDASPWRERIRIEPITPDVLPWYALADMLICASDVESLPRTVLEAMALETPVLATAVFGLPELITHGTTGWLCPPRDISALAAALDEALGTTPDARADVARAARALVEERHSLERYGDAVAALIANASSEPAIDS